VRILMIISESPPTVSGMARVSYEICKRLTSLGHSVDVISSNNIPRIVVGEIRLSSMIWKGVGFFARNARNYDIIHIHGPVPTFSDVALIFLSMLLKTERPPIVYSHHCEIMIPKFHLACKCYNTINNKIIQLSDHIVTTTPYYAGEFLNKKNKANVSIIPWGVEHKRPSEKKGDLKVLFVGQMRAYKGLETLIYAFNDVKDATLDIIGGGHLFNQYAKLSRELDLRNIYFRGEVSDVDIDHFFEEAHVIVLPSITTAEAFGLVLLEGMSAGCVPIASRLPGLIDVVNNSGYTFNPGNTQELARILNNLKDNRAKMKELSHKSVIWASKFSWDKTVKAYEVLFANLVKGHVSFSVNCFPHD
jgi:glycosyltransferase involved in cell wall biosynthesis